MAPKSKTDPSSLLLNFLNEKNRPYSATNLVDELHGEFSKTVIQKSLDSLVDSNQIVCKLCGKTTKLYYANQDGKETATKEQLLEMDQRNDELNDRIKELQTKRDELLARRNVLISKRTIEDLRKWRITIEQNLNDEKDKTQQLIKEAEGITPDESNKILLEFSKRCEEWKKRQKLCKEIIDKLSEQASKKPEELFEEQGLDADESYNVKLEVIGNKKYRVVHL